MKREEWTQRGDYYVNNRVFEGEKAPDGEK